RRFGRFVRPQATPLFRSSAVERQGPDSQGAPLRPDRQRRQPRRGRQRVLLLSRLDADALVHEIPLQVPAAAYPYSDLVETNRRRTRNEMEYELLDTGVFNENRYFDVFVEYAKGSPEDILVQITVANRGPEEAELHLL